MFFVQTSRTDNFDSRVMITYNLNVKDRLRSRKSRKITEFLAESSDDITSQISMMQQLVNNSFNSFLTFSNFFSASVPIFRTSVTFNVWAKADYAAWWRFLQVNIRLTKALTCHKVQSQSFPPGQTIVCELGQADSDRSAERHA